MKLIFFSIVCLFSCVILGMQYFLLHQDTTMATTRKKPHTRHSPRQEKISLHPASERGLLASSEQLSEIEGLVEQCMETTHITDFFRSPSLLEQAKANAKYMYQEYRKVIPATSLAGHRSHCWRDSYSAHWNDSHYSSRIGNTTYHGELNDLDIHRRQFREFSAMFPSRKFESDLVCLPKVFMTGYPKCGSSFAHCFTNKLIYRSLYKYNTLLSSKKEPHFWVIESTKGIPNSGKYEIPTAEKIGKYLFYFIPGLKQISKFGSKDAIFVDAKVNKMFKWPLFEKSQHNLTNYCLLPTVIPKMLPGSKFIVIMRNPVTMLYSVFWYTCTYHDKPLPAMLNRLKGPDIFHDRVVHKIKVFNNCMRDTSSPAISHVCELDDYSSCIKERLHLLEKCAHAITFNMASPEMPNCGRTRVSAGLYYAHIRKWFSILPRKDFLILTLEELIRNPPENAREILQFLDLNTDIADSKSKIQEAVGACTIKANTQVLIDYHHDKRFQMRTDTKALLESFFSPFNDLLSKLVGRSLPWNY